MRIIPVIIMLLVLCGAGICEESQLSSKNKNTQPSNSRQTADNKEYKKPEKIISVKILPAPDADATAAKEEKKEQEKSNVDNIIAYSTLGLGIVTAVLAVFTGALWLATRKLVIDAKDTSKRQLRAYVNILQGKVFYPLEPANRTFRIDIKNFGQTPAHEVSIVYKCIIREFPLTKPLEDITDEEHKFFSVMGPTCIYTRDILALGNAEWGESKLADGTAAIYCFGEVRYRDTFNDNRITEFRYMCQGEGIVQGGVAPCEEGNNAT